MSDWARVFVFSVVVVDPVTMALATLALAKDRGEAQRRVLLGVGTVVAATVLVGTAFVADPLLDWLNISSGAAQLAAGIVLFVPALELLFGGPANWVRPAPAASAVRLGAFPLGVPVVAAPWTIVAVLAFAAADGVGTAASAVALAVVVCGALALLLSKPADRMATRFLGGAVGAATALIGADLVWEGVFG